MTIDAGQGGAVGAGSQGAAPATAGVVTQGGAAATGTTAAAGTGVAGGASTESQPFFAGIQDESLRGWVQAKGWSDVSALAKSAHSLEKMIGAPADEVVRVPKNADPATLRTVFSRLGMPDAADKYTFETVEGLTIDKNYEAGARELFHKAGLTNEQAKALTKWNAEFIKARNAQSETDYKTAVAADEQALRNEWKAGYDTQMVKAKNVANAVGVTEQQLDAIEKSLGYGNTMKFFANLATKFGEDSFVGQGSGTPAFNGTMTPAQAQAEYDKLRMDANWVTALMDKKNPGHEPAMAKKSDLMRLIHG